MKRKHKDNDISVISSSLKVSSINSSDSSSNAREILVQFQKATVSCSIFIVRATSLRAQRTDLTDVTVPPNIDHAPHPASLADVTAII